MPKEPEELTETIVLTSQRSFFVDIRILKAEHIEESRRGLETNSSAILQWAFAGTSESTQQEGKKMSVWHHWIDSESVEPDEDKGEMIEQANGDILERGINVDPKTGQETTYEELWTDLKVEKVGSEPTRTCVVLRMEDIAKGSKGMVIRVGSWCQGILKQHDALTAERWQWTADYDPSDTHKWRRTVRLGNGELPCDALCHGDGLQDLRTVECGGASWEVVEMHIW